MRLGKQNRGILLPVYVPIPVRFQSLWTLQPVLF